MEQIVGGEECQRRLDAGPCRVVAHGLSRLDDGALGLDERFRQHYPADVMPPPVVAFEPRGVAVGFLGPTRHWPPRQLTNAGQMGFCERQFIGS
ncbi:Uncharacterised protein [Mycobacterium tuberculosis]|nr:Uncharacterised protein [Mycobacterium tuberculosis]